MPENEQNKPIDESKLDYTVTDLLIVPKLKLLTYIDAVTHIGQRIEALTGINYLIPIVQSAHESAYGNSGLARNHCNLFGITATKSWKEQNKPVALMQTWEVINGNRVDMKREFRKYPSWSASFDDWAHIITNLSCYKKAYELLSNKDTISQGIVEMGKVYATDPRYAVKLLELYDYIKAN